jgi:hypothetical protein
MEAPYPSPEPFSSQSPKFAATMMYHKTKDILHVMKVLGHKNIQNTLKYTQLVNIKDDEFVCKTAKTVDEIETYIETCFDYVCEIDEISVRVDLWCRGPDLNRRQPGVRFLSVFSRVLSQAELPRPAKNSCLSHL